MEDDRYSRGSRDQDDRGFFQRAGDEISSWFGDDDRRDSESDRFDRGPKYRDEGYRRPYTGRYSGRQDFGGREPREGGYRPMTGDYGRASERGFERDRPTSGSSFSGMASTSTGAHDRHYDEWKKRQIDELDRDYEDYRRENQSRFDSDFSQWRSTRQGKRQMLGSVREHMQVVGSDEQPVGTVDKVSGDRILLTRNDSPDGQHHMLSCTTIERVEGDRVILDKPADEATRMLSSDNRERALFERGDDRASGPHILDRSFSGTY